MTRPLIGINHERKWRLLVAVRATRDPDPIPKHSGQVGRVFRAINPTAQSLARGLVGISLQSL
jgi:hypothetical protein